MAFNDFSDFDDLFLDDFDVLTGSEKKKDSPGKNGKKKKGDVISQQNSTKKKAVDTDQVSNAGSAALAGDSMPGPGMRKTSSRNRRSRTTAELTLEAAKEEKSFTDTPGVRSVSEPSSKRQAAGARQTAPVQSDRASLKNTPSVSGGKVDNRAERKPALYDQEPGGFEDDDFADYFGFEDEFDEMDYYDDGYDPTLEAKLKKQEEEEALRASEPEAVAQFRKRREEARRQAEIQTLPEEDDEFGGKMDTMSMGSFEDDGGYADEVADRRRADEVEQEMFDRRTTGRRKSSREDIINKRAYNIDKVYVDPADAGYDGYYENVEPIDDGKSIHGSVSPMTLLMAAGLVLGILCMLYYVFTTLGL